jgi:5-methylcytosine-specific restriction endonuclease McrA
MAQKKHKYGATKKRLIILLDVDDRSLKLDEAFYKHLVLEMGASIIKMNFGLLMHENKRQFRIDNHNALCYLCDSPMSYKPSKGGRQSANSATIDHVIPIWILKALDVFQLIVDPRNFQMCCSKCNHDRGTKLVTVGDIRKDLGDKVINSLFNSAGVWLADDISYSDYIGDA